jgi:transposase
MRGGQELIGVDQYQHIRHLSVVEGLSQRAIARRLGISRKTVRRYCLGQNMPWEKRPITERQKKVITKEVKEFVKQCFEQDKLAPLKQHHTAKRIYDRLVNEKGFQGAEPTVRRLVAQLRPRNPDVYVPLAFSPGEAAQVDWGTATVVIAGEKTTAHLFCVRLCSSCAPFVMAFPVEREETFLEAHQRAFDYFGGVARTLAYDNLKTAVKEGWGKFAREQDKFLAFRAHYAYETWFCTRAEAHEKGLVEGLVGYIRRNVLVPIPEADSWSELNELLLERCRRYTIGHQIRGRELPVREAFAIERAALIPLPVKPYDTTLSREPRVDYYATVPFDKNRYSVPVNKAHQIVTVKGSAFLVEIWRRGELIACHERCYAQGRTRYRLEHYLPLLEERPRAVRNARPVREANLPEEFRSFSLLLEDPDRGMVKLLRLMVDYGQDKVLTAVKRALELHQNSVDVVAYYATADSKAPVIPIKGPAVQPVDLTCYDSLLAGGGMS